MRRMHSSQFRMMLLYFTLAVSVIAVFWIVTNLETIGGWIGWAFTVMGPFIAGFIISYILSIPVNGMQRLLYRTNVSFIRTWKKAISVIVVYLIFVFGVYFSISLLVPPTIVAIVDLIANFPIFYQQIVTGLEIFLDDLPFYWTPDAFFAEFLYFAVVQS